MHNDIKTLILLGKPGAGKGTQSGILKQRMRFSTIGYGDFFRSMTQNDNFIAKKIKQTLDKGDILPYWFPSYVLADHLLNKIAPDEPVILDGAARSRKEAEFIHELLDWFERPYRALYIDISDQVAVARLNSRRELIHRADDDAEHIQNRLRAYHHTVIPAIDFFREQGNLIEINGDQSMEGVSKEIIQKLSDHGVDLE
jgi:adenylate kinase